MKKHQDSTQSHLHIILLCGVAIYSCTAILEYLNISTGNISTYLLAFISGFNISLFILAIFRSLYLRKARQNG